ncbi:MAG: hypothetical protein KJP21_00905 [Bacteroidia bacterium]|nr:hypothetical protein [Bacteroidia bacterium]
MAITEGNKDKKSRRYLLIMILALLALNIGLIYQIITGKQEKEEIKKELFETTSEKQELETLKADLEVELDKYKGQNQSLDSIISVRDTEIQAKVYKIKKMLSSGNLTKSELKKANELIASLRSDKEALTKEIEELSKENQYLKDENYVMQKQVEAEKEKVAEMTEVISERDKQVEVGSRIFLKSVNANPLRDAVFGEYKTTDKLNRLNKIEISYTLGNNDLASKGEKTLYFQVVTPNKSTLHNGKAGSGTFNYEEGERLYTVKKVVNFQNSNESSKFSIPKTEGMTAGKYTVNVYSDAHKMGSTEFTLR